MNKLKRFFTISVMVMTVVVMSGALVSPVSASATAGDLIKMDGLTSVYYLGDDGKRYVFPNETTYFSWYSDWSSVVTISSTELTSYPLGDNVVMRAGTKLVKITTDPKVYAVEPAGVLRHVATEADAIALFGDNWASRVVDVPDAFFTNYTVGSALATAEVPAGTVVKNEGSSDMFYYDGTDYRKFDNDAAFTANRLKFDDVVTTTGVTAGGSMVTSVETMANTAQTGTIIVTPDAGTGLSVALSATTPASSSVPSDATRVNFTNFNVTASNDGDVTIDEIVIKRTGLGTTSEIYRVFVYDGDVRMNNGRSISSDTHEAEISALGIVVAAGTTKTLSIAVTTGTGAGGEHVLSVQSINASGATVTGSFPISGNQMTISSTSAGTVTVDKVGTIGDPTIGEVQAEVTSFKLTAGTKDILLEDIALKNVGDLTTSLMSNFTLMQGTTEIPVTASVDGRFVTLSLATPYEITDGVSKNFTLKADISTASEVGKTIRFIVYNAADVNAVSEQYGYGVTPTITAYTGANYHALTTLGGAVTITNLTSPASDVKTNSTEVELMKVAITASDDSIEVEQMKLSIATVKVNASSFDYGTYKDGDADGTPTGNNTDDYDASVDTILIKNIKIKDADTGVTLGSSKAITDASNWATTLDVDVTLNFTYDDYFSISKDQTRNIVVIADIDSNQISGVTYKATLDFTHTSAFIVKDSQDNTVTDIVPSTTIAGEFRTTRTSSLTVARASTPETITAVAGSEVDALGFILTTGSGEGNEVKVSGLTINVYVNDNTANTVFVDTTEGTVDANELVSEVSLYVGDTKIAGPVAVDSSGNAVFTSNKFVGGYYEVAAGSNVTVVAKATTSGNAPYGSTDDAFAFSFVAADITAEDSEGSVTATVTGTELNSNILTNPSVFMGLTSAGTVIIAADAGTPDAAVILANGTEQELARVKLDSTKENFDVDELTFIVSSGADDDLEYLKLYDTVGNALSGNVSLDASRKANFTGLTIEVPKTGDFVVVVKGMVKAIGERTTATDGTVGVGADSGTSITITTDTTANDFRAVGQSSGTVDVAAEATTGNAMVIRKSIPTITVLELPSDVLGDGSKTIAKFSVTADAAGDITFAGIKPDSTLNDAVVAVALALTNINLYDVTGGNEVDLTTGAGVAVDAFVASTTPRTIAASTTKTFELRGTVANSAINDSITTVFTKDAIALTGDTENDTDAIADASNVFVWSDQSADTHTLGTSVEYTNAFVLPSWDSTVSSLTRS